MDITLSKQAFYEAWKHFNLGTKPLVLNVLPQGILQTERYEAEKQAKEELRRHGFGDRDREDDIYGAFLPLHRYEKSFDITYRRRGETEHPKVTGLVASVRNGATLAVQNEETVRVTTLPADSMVRALLSVIPDMQPGPGKSVSVRSKQLETAASGAGSSERAMGENLVRQGVRREDARALLDMMSAQRHSYAQFGASAMDGRGKRARAGMVTNCFATSGGWYMLEESARGSEAWTTIAPVDKNRMGARVQDLLKTIRMD